MRSSLQLYSILSGLAAILLGIGIALSGFSGEVQEWIFLCALALWHGIYAIWFWKGKELIAFARITVVGRAFSGISYWLVLGLLPDAEGSLMILFRTYLTVQGSIDLGSAAITAFSVLQKKEADGKDRSLSLEEKNRFVFAIYMTLLSVWILADSFSFLKSFHLPPTSFSGWTALRFGPIHILAAQIFILAIYNFTAVRFRLTPLIEAGMRGGMVTCIFFVVLVLFGVLHPITLLLPGADLISVAVILFARLRKRQ